MAVTVTQSGEDERGVVYEIGLSTAADAAQAQLIGDDPEGLLWQLGKVSWHKTVNVTVSFTNAGGAAMAVASGNGVLAGWVAHPDSAKTEASETLPITGLRFTASTGNQTVRLYTGKRLKDDPVDAGTPA